MKSKIALTALLCAGLSVPLAARADAVYTVTVLGGVDSVAYDVNNRGQVVGYMAANEGYRGFLYDDSGLNDLGTLGDGGSYAYRINEAGSVVGTSYAGGERFAFVYAGGAMTALPTGAGSDAGDINNAGVITGTYASTDSDGFYQPHAYTYANGVMTDLGTFGYGSYGNGINDRGHVAGTAEVDGPPNWPTDPFFYSDGVMQNIGNFGGIFSQAWAINNHDQVVGSAGSENIGGNLYPRRAFLYSDGVMHDLGTMKYGGDSAAYAINELGQVVGYTDTDTGGASFLYANGKMVLLDTLIDSASGWTITDANGINDLGQIAGRACKGDLCYAVRLDLAPIPEPGHVAMLGAGLLVLLGKRTVRALGGRKPGAPVSAYIGPAFG